MTSQDYIKVNTSRLDFLALVLQSSNSFDLNVFFFKFCLVYFLLFTRALFNCCTYGPCIPRGCLVSAKSFSGFFSSEIFKRFSRWNPYFPKVLRFLCYFCLLLWGIDFATARGSPASVSDHVMTSQDYIKVNTSGLDFLALVLQSFNSFDLNVFF